MKQVFDINLQFEVYLVLITSLDKNRIAARPGPPAVAPFRNAEHSLSAA